MSGAGAAGGAAGGDDAMGDAPRGAELRGGSGAHHHRQRRDVKLLGSAPLALKAAR
jgi:hypothetical protein